MRNNLAKRLLSEFLISSILSSIFSLCHQKEMQEGLMTYPCHKVAKPCYPALKLQRKYKISQQRYNFVDNFIALRNSQGYTVCLRPHKAINHPSMLRIPLAHRLTILGWCTP